MSKKTLFSLPAVLFILSSGLQAQFVRTYGGTEWEQVSTILTTPDGGFIVAGTSRSFGSNSQEVPWLIKLTAGGAVAWEKLYSLGEYSPNSWFASLMIEGGGITLMARTYDSLWLLKTDGQGVPASSAAVYFSPLAGLYFGGICPGPDGGIYIVGHAQPGATDDIWAARLSADGAVLWQKAYDFGAQEMGIAAAAAAEGGLVVAGSQTGAADSIDKLIVCGIDPLGAVSWQRSYSSTGANLAGSPAIGAAADGGFLVAEWYGYVLKLSGDGALEWATSIPATLSGLTSTADGGSILTGVSADNMLVVKLGAAGDIEWQRAYGGPFGEAGMSVVQTALGDYAVAGNVSSFGAGNQDYGVVRFPAGGEVGSCRFSKTSELTSTALDVAAAELSSSSVETQAAPETQDIIVADTQGESQSFHLCAGLKLLTIRNSVGRGGITDPESGTYLYPPGSTVEISAEPSFVWGDYTYNFSGWSGDVTSGANPQTIEITDDTSVRADYWGEWSDTDQDSGHREGCFIATAAYRSPLSPAVRLLRDFRDRRLLTNVMGRAVVEAYYKSSPAIARVIAGSPILRSGTRVLLLPVIAVAFLVLKLGWLATLLVMAAATALAVRRVRLRLRPAR